MIICTPLNVHATHCLSVLCRFEFWRLLADVKLSSRLHLFADANNTAHLLNLLAQLDIEAGLIRDEAWTVL